MTKVLKAITNALPVLNNRLSSLPLWQRMLVACLGLIVVMIGVWFNVKSQGPAENYSILATIAGVLITLVSAKADGKKNNE